MKKVSRFASPLLTVLLLASPAFAADTSSATDPQDIATLKAQISKLAKKVDQLEAQDKKAKATAATATSTAAPATATPAATATDPAVDQSAAAQTAVAKTAPVNSADVVTKGSFPGSFHVPGTDTSVKIGGYVKLDAIEDIGSSYGQSFSHFYAIPLSNSPASQQSSQTSFSAQQTRVNLETRTPSSLGEIRTFVEGDFYNGTAATNSNLSNYGFELRHAYGSVGAEATGQVLAGMTWSNFMDVPTMPESLDYLGPASTVFARQPQVRYTQAVGPVTLSGSVELPSDSVQSTGVGGGASIGTFAGNSNGAASNSVLRSSMPDFIAHAQYNYASDGYVALRAVGNETNVDRTANVTNNDTASKLGYGVAVSGKQVVTGKDNVRYDFVLGDGTGRYDYDVGTAEAYYNSSTNVLKITPYYGGTVGYQHYWSDHFRSNLFGGAVRLVNDTNFMDQTVLAAANKYVASGHANLIWQPVSAYQVGIEYMRGYRKTEAGVEGSLNRAQASFIYSF